MTLFMERDTVLKRSMIKDMSKEEFKNYISKSNSYTDALRKMGYNSPNQGGSFRTLKKYINKYNCDTSHFHTKTEDATRKNTIPLEDILVENSTYTNNQKLKERLIKANLLEYKCSCCGNEGIWNGKKLTLQLEHINGIHRDNRLKNLTLLCPNCHSQTSTFGVGNYGDHSLDD